MSDARAPLWSIWRVPNEGHFTRWIVVRESGGAISPGLVQLTQLRDDADRASSTLILTVEQLLELGARERDERR